MSWWRRIMGIDGFEFALQAVITTILMAWAAEVNSPQDAFVIGSMIAVGSLLLLGIRRRLALRRGGRETPPELEAERMAELEQRVAELEMDRARIAELEERLDFAERLLATHKETARELAP
ncbi:MAG TPA: hypothetical protein VIP80_11565 [Gemmatimonadales bacterium]|jgi:hypothetical protein